jgi:hypothetical protein
MQTPSDEEHDGYKRRERIPHAEASRFDQLSLEVDDLRRQLHQQAQLAQQSQPPAQQAVDVSAPRPAAHEPPAHPSNVAGSADLRGHDEVAQIEAEITRHKKLTQVRVLLFVAASCHTRQEA